MALFHAATVKPRKSDLIEEWLHSQSWGPAADEPIEVLGAFRFDDPEGQVGLETHLVSAGGRLFQVPLSYRDKPLEGAEDALISTMEHSALGTRWVYNGMGDARYVLMLAAVAMTGQGEALGMAEYEGRWHIAPTHVRIRGGGWGSERVAVDEFRAVSENVDSQELQNERFEMTVFRRPTPGTQPPIGLTATWNGQPDPVVLATVRER
ncbi:MAG: hypothetical protein HKN91_07930 [Acidimicrobiia bacterium]|nr:hypothetical protein [Acidimicrobiia bacterium]